MNPPAFQFYPAEFLADENVVLMTNQELGCYMKLMCYCWREGSIPSEMSKLSRLCGEDGSAMAQLWLSLGRCFETSEADPSRLVHPRLERERSKQNAFRSERSISGSKGAKSMWEKRLKEKSPLNSTLAQPKLSHDLAKAHEEEDADEEVHSSLKEGGVGETCAPPAPDRKRPESWPALAEVLLHADKIGLPASEGEKFFHHYEAQGWKDKNGHDIHNWRSKLQNWKVNWDEKRAKEKQDLDRKANFYHPQTPEHHSVIDHRRLMEKALKINDPK